MEEILRDLNLEQFTVKMKEEKISFQAFQAFNNSSMESYEDKRMKRVLIAKVGLTSSQIIQICDHIQKKSGIPSVPTPSYSELGRSPNMFHTGSRVT